MAYTYAYGMYTWVHQGRTMDTRTPRNAHMDMDKMGMGMDMDMDMNMGMDMDKMDMDVP